MGSSFSSSSSSWVRIITTPFRKACILIRPPSDRRSKSQTARHDCHRRALQGEVMACSYQDVQVMWSMLDKSGGGGGDGGDGGAGDGRGELAAARPPVRF